MVGQRFALPRLVGAENRLADFRSTVAILEVGAVWRYRFGARDRAQQMVKFVHECVLPTDGVSGRPPKRHERVVRLGHQNPLKTGLARFFPADSKLVEALEIKADRPARAVDLERELIEPAGAQT